MGDAVTLECVVPISHVPGQKMSWVSPTGQRLALVIPDEALPGQTLEFDIPLHVLAEPEPDPFAGMDVVIVEMKLPSDWVEGQKLMTQLQSGQKVVFIPPPGSLPGMSLEFKVPRQATVPSPKSAPATSERTQQPPSRGGSRGGADRIYRG